MLAKGFRFGMLLQLSIGPMCLLVFNTAGTQGVWMGLLLVFAIALVDAVYIALAGIGVASFINRKRVRLAMKWFGCIVLVLFGVNAILSAFHDSLLPNVRLFSSAGESADIFIQGIVLTASNPLTIIFWGGVFSAKASGMSMNRRQLLIFGLGCVLSTVVFLCAVSVLGSVVNTFLPQKAIMGLHVIVGCVLIGFGIRLLLKKDSALTGVKENSLEEER